MHRGSFGRGLTAVVTALAFLTALLGPAQARAAAKLKIMAATMDLASLAQEVGGDKVEVESIARGYQDPHFVDAKPSFLLKLKRADLLIVVGLELEIGWLPPLINQSTNPKIQVAAPGYLDASRFARILEIPTGQVTRAEGDVHPLGNPHYWLDPENGLRIAKGIADKLSEMRPEDAAYFAQRYADFEQRLKQADQRWLAEMKPYEGRKIVTYHRSWPNFAEHFHLNVVGYVEPRPGIPPSPQHTVELIQQMKRENVKVIVVEPYFDLKTPNSIARETGGQVLVLPPSVGGEKEITDYFKLFDYDISKLKQAFDATH
ncbi:MAG TPA: metal ABC transporter substrate-binding protein [Candidatus Saccharimonadales bacterium]|jgi:zinc/manganese transport system substrate-binding protein|nr:metal ABC transporter substrate-binding protein [Candidatus Saccharimonadales bacterium]